MERILFQSLTVKLVLTVGAVVCLIVGIGAFALMKGASKRIAETLVTTSLYQAQYLKGKLIETMMNETFDPAQLQQVIGSEKDRLGLAEINIFNAKGIIRFSTVPRKIDQAVDLTTTDADRFTRDQGVIHFQEKGAKGTLRIVHPVHSRAACMRCHDVVPGAALGGIELHVSLAPIFKRFAENRLFMIIAAGGIILLSAVLIRWVVRTIVRKPIRQLISEMEKAQRGQLDAKISIRGDADLKRLSESFNAMIRGFRRAQQKIAEQHRRELAHSNRLASLGQFISNISHEIKNPLAAMSSTLHALKSELQPGQDPEIFTELIMQVGRIEKTLHNLLRYARQKPPSFDRCPLADPVQQAFHLAEHFLRSRNIRFQVTAKSPGLAVCGDEGQLEQVFLNLFLNSANAMPEGGVLSVRIEPVPDGVLTEVEDTGLGMDADVLASIFEPFFTTRADGTGLGLSVSKGIIEAHHGSIRARSLPGKGTILSIILPAAAESAVDEASVEAGRMG